MTIEWLIVIFLIGSAIGWLINRVVQSSKSKKSGGCSGGCGCSSKTRPPRS